MNLSPLSCSFLTCELAIQLEPMRALQQGINSLLFPV
ncbi:hypothetical protein COLO4_24108 [Corchorus olitorius]|uniref:Uncharacterized protein n=1 Tax=Corchorus olitorius TaxID=93759 RepID=A0A1R3ICW4_9ROSI|nr:hypothetical protein COLO4_24108 [Corchorus olitorius]